MRTVARHIQVMLYDTTRRLLDNRFLKRDEIVSSGELFVFDCHLVDIGELQKDNKPTKDLALQGINCNAVVKTETTYNKANPTNGKFHAGTSTLLLIYLHFYEACYFPSAIYIVGFFFPFNIVSGSSLV